MKEQKKREEEERKQKEIAAIKEAQERAKVRTCILFRSASVLLKALFCKLVGIHSHIFMNVVACYGH